MPIDRGGTYSVIPEDEIDGIPVNRRTGMTGAMFSLKEDEMGERPSGDAARWPKPLIRHDLELMEIWE